MTDKKITQLTAATSLVASDLLPVVTDNSTTPATKKITVENAFKSGKSVSFVGAKVRRNVTQNCDNTTATAISYDTEVFDISNCWSNSNPTRLVAPVTGYYMVGGGWAMTSGSNTAASRLIVQVLLNGTTTTASQEVHTIAGKAVSLTVCTLCYLAANEYAEIIMYHDEGATKTIAATTSTNHSAGYGFITQVG